MGNFEQLQKILEYSGKDLEEKGEGYVREELSNELPLYAVLLIGIKFQLEDPIIDETGELVEAIYEDVEDARDLVKDLRGLIEKRRAQKYSIGIGRLYAIYIKARREQETCSPDEKEFSRGIELLVKEKLERALEENYIKVLWEEEYEAYDKFRVSSAAKQT